MAVNKQLTTLALRAARERCAGMASIRGFASMIRSFTSSIRTFEPPAQRINSPVRGLELAIPSWALGNSKLQLNGSWLQIVDSNVRIVRSQLQIGRLQASNRQFAASNRRVDLPDRSVFFSGPQPLVHWRSPSALAALDAAANPQFGSSNNKGKNARSPFPRLGRQSAGRNHQNEGSTRRK